VITDDIGRPVPGAAVSFHLPDEGPSGLFPNGLRTEVVTTDAHGRASLRALQWNRRPGRFQIRIIASKEQVRAGTVSFQYIVESPSRTKSAQTASQPRGTSGKARWLAVLALVGGGAAAGFLASHGTTNSAPVAPAAPPVTSPALTVGPPSITVGKQ
jgi:hypothetical protein